MFSASQFVQSSGELERDDVSLASVGCVFSRDMHEIFPTKSERGQEKNSYLRMATIRLNSHSGRYLKFVKITSDNEKMEFDFWLWNME